MLSPTEFLVVMNNEIVMFFRTCTNPDVSFFPSWKVDDLLTWPICRNDANSNSSQNHLTCELVGRPCCFGIQASCNITTREHCEFLQGRFHQDAFLCSQVRILFPMCKSPVCATSLSSQVDCLSGICGLLPFTEPNKPDQFYRLWIALFLHAGLVCDLVYPFICCHCAGSSPLPSLALSISSSHSSSHSLSFAMWRSD